MWPEYPPIATSWAIWVQEAPTAHARVSWIVTLVYVFVVVKIKPSSFMPSIVSPIDLNLKQNRKMAKVSYIYFCFPEFICKHIRKKCFKNLIP